MYNHFAHENYSSFQSAQPYIPFLHSASSFNHDLQPYTPPFQQQHDGQGGQQNFQQLSHPYWAVPEQQGDFYQVQQCAESYYDLEHELQGGQQDFQPLSQLDESIIDHLQQRSLITEFQDMTHQLAQLTAAVKELKSREAVTIFGESKEEAMNNESPMVAALDSDSHNDFTVGKTCLEVPSKDNNYTLVLQYFEMDFEADLCDPEFDFNSFNDIKSDFKNIIIEPAVIMPIHSEIVNSAMVIEPIGIDAFESDLGSNMGDLFDIDAIFEDDMLETNENIVVELHVHADFDVDSIGAISFSEYEVDAAAVVVTKTSNPVLHAQQVVMDREVLELQQNGVENQSCAYMKTLGRLDEHVESLLKSHFLIFFTYSVNLAFSLACVISKYSIELRMVEHSVFYIKLKKINFDLWPI